MPQPPDPEALLTLAADKLFDRQENALSALHDMRLSKQPAEALQAQAIAVGLLEAAAQITAALVDALQASRGQEDQGS